MINIGFITGARSDYGVMKPVIQTMADDNRFCVTVIVTGMHFLQRYGNTIEEIYKDQLASLVEVPCYREEEQSKENDFVTMVDSLYPILKRGNYDVVYIIGDRLEAYAAALAAHFAHIPIAHYAGGQLTEGAVDNTYRYNISNLATIHLVTNKYAEERLKQIPIINSDKIYLVGSSAIDAIYKYLDNPKDASCIDSRLKRGNYVLMTFHSETQRSSGDGCSIPEMMDAAINYIIENGQNVLITYPNNDDGASEIISVIHRWQEHPQIIVRKNLGAQLYYVAVDNAQYIIGNSSSAIIEVPYFYKYSMDIGVRQKGRNAPATVIRVPNRIDMMIEYMKQLQDNAKLTYVQEHIYGSGNAVTKIKEVLITEFIK